jgi:beta-glucosidase
MVTTRVDRLLDELTLDEKAALTAGADVWSTVGIERVSIPPVVLTDGPNGARGPTVPGAAGAASLCVPCGSALGATWNPELVERVGQALGQQARTKGARVLLAPTVNLHRSPLAGRNFECYSEDPLLSGRLAAAYVRGVQSTGVATTVKHFVGNDSEFERTTISSEIDARTLRELYLVPFELAVREGGTLGLMTSYNRLNGRYCSEQPELLQGILRDEWGFDGFVVSDWFALGSTLGWATAGLDLEMPGPGRLYGTRLADAVRRGEVEPQLLDDAVARLMGVFDRIGALDDELAPPESVDLPAHRELAREAAAESIVLLRNDGMLPIDASTVRTLAVIGPNADRAQIMGGGSASLRPHYRVTPLRALRDRIGPDVEVLHERGCDIDVRIPLVRSSALATADGGSGFAIEYFAGEDLDGEVVHRATQPQSQFLFLGSPGPDVPVRAFSMRARATFTAPEDGIYTFGLSQAGRARLLFDGDVVLDGVTDPPPPGSEFFGMGSQEITALVELAAGERRELVVEYSSRGAPGIRGVRVGCRVPVPPDLMERAVSAATRADAVVLVVGTTDEWESEGHDRTSMDLPGDQDELVASVLAANRRTVVVVNTGAPVTMDWADDAAAVLQVWFGGQEMAGAIADVLLGDAEPAGRLPTTFPVRVEHNPSFGNFPGENGQIRYGEGLLVGYRWYEARHLPVRYPFGHGLSYTTFTLGPAQTSSTTIGPGGGVTVRVEVTNTGARRGAEVVQCYVAPLSPSLFRPERELKGFAKVWLERGESAVAQIHLAARAFAWWDPGDAGGWRVDAGDYDLHVGRSSADAAAVARVNAPTGFSL